MHGRDLSLRWTRGRAATLFPRLRSFLTTLIWRQRFEEDLDEELRSHLAEHAEDLMRAGVPPAEAARRARAHFGSLDRTKDACRFVRGLRMADELEMDLRLAARRIVKDRWHSLGAACVLALAIGAATGMFTLVNGILLRGLSANDERIVSLGACVAGGCEAGVSLSDLEDWAAGARTFSGMAAYVPVGVTVGDDVDHPAVLPAASVSSNLFELLGTRPALGRTFSATDEQPDPVVLGHALWQGRYGADPAIVGREIRIDARLAVVVGVMPEGFKFPAIADLWMPIALADGAASRRDAPRFLAVGRIADGAGMDEARAELETIASRLAERHPETHRGVQPVVQGFSERTLAPQRGLLRILMAAVCLVLLIACTNVSGLLPSWSAQRSGEAIVHTALGASRGRIFDQG